MCARVCLAAVFGPAGKRPQPKCSAVGEGETHRKTQKAEAGHTKPRGKVVERILLKRKKASHEDPLFLDVENGLHKHVPMCLGST